MSIDYKYKYAFVNIFNDDSDEIVSYASMEYDTCVEIYYESPKINKEVKNHGLQIFSLYFDSKISPESGNGRKKALCLHQLKTPILFNNHV